jgi:hypothetical protein
MILTRALSTSSKSGYSFRFFTCLAIAALTFNAAARGATINYGNFGPVPPGVSFLQVTESSGTDPVPLYGPPTPFSVGLDFNPVFTSSSSGGSADITDGQLNFTIMTGPGGLGIGGIGVSESGDYSLAGLPGGPPTSVFAGAIIRATITQINNLPVAPINLPPVNASFSDSLPGAVIAGPWSLGLSQNIAAALGPGQNATKVEVVINNSLVTTSEPPTVAFIAKKDFRIDITPGVPEPSTLVLALLGSVAAFAWPRLRG